MLFYRLLKKGGERGVGGGGGLVTLTCIRMFVNGFVL